MSHHSIDIKCSKCRAYMFSTYSGDDCGKDHLCDKCKPKAKPAKKKFTDLADGFAHRHGVYTHGMAPNKTEGDAWWAFNEAELRDFVKAAKDAK